MGLSPYLLSSSRVIRVPDFHASIWLTKGENKQKTISQRPLQLGTVTVKYCPLRWSQVIILDSPEPALKDSCHMPFILSFFPPYYLGGRCDSWNSGHRFGTWGQGATLVSRKAPESLRILWNGAITWIQNFYVRKKLTSTVFSHYYFGSLLMKPNPDKASVKNDNVSWAVQLWFLCFSVRSTT